METQQKSKVHVYACAICFVLVVGPTSMVSKLSAAYGLPVLVVALRFLLSVCFNFTVRRSELSHEFLKKREKRKLLWLSGFLYAGDYLLNILGLTYAPSILNGILFATVPITSDFFAAIILRERPSLRQVAFLILSAGSVITMFVLSSAESLDGTYTFGFLVLFISLACQALNNVIIRYLRDEYSPVEISFSTCGIAFLVSCCVLAVQLALGIAKPASFRLALSSSDFLIAVLYLGIFGTFIAGLMRGIMLQNMSTMRSTIWYNLCTPATVILGVLFLHEPFRLYHLICTIIIIFSVLAIQHEKSRNAA